MGKTYAFYLTGIAAANIISGYLAHFLNFRATYFITIISCVAATIIVLTIKEPTFHKSEQKERILQQLSSTTKTIVRSKMIFTLTLILSALTVV